ncbi:MAG: chitobiase/beta-hexosaminidase C-terminal domain-containing protein [Prevotella sp.]|nr:chitobiase/beta-hexosaminidase C-terminal domain-containing protein [Prevotella sp.]
MKKIYFIIACLFFAVCINAQERRTDWDFTQGWSKETVSRLEANIALGGDWTTERAGQWGQIGKRSAGELTIEDVSGEEWVIPETKGLLFGATAAKHIIVAYDYAGDGNDFYGKSMLWINGNKAQDYVTITGVLPGDKIIIVYESHNPSQERGMKATTAGVTVEGTEGEVQSVTMGIDTVTYVTGTDFLGGDVTFQATSGFHIYRIAINELKENEPIDTRNKIAYIYNSTFPGYSLETDLMRFYIGDEEINPNAVITDIDLANNTIDAAQLLEYDLLLLSNAISKDEKQANTLKRLFVSVPILNLSSSLYEAWGIGKQVQTNDCQVTLTEKGKTSECFKELVTDEGLLPLFSDANIVGIETVGNYLANDDILAKVGDVTAIHMHSPNRNAYMLLPFDIQNADYATNEFATLIINSISHLISTKRLLSQAAMPSISLEYKDMTTMVTLKTLSSPSHIYYTLDGTEPTENSLLYSEPFPVTEEGIVVKAITIAEGYYDSDVLTSDVIELRAQAKSPTIGTSKIDNATEVVISCETSNAQIYFNYSGSSLVSESQLYTNSFTISHRTEITAFATAEGMVQSEPVKLLVTVEGESLRIDTLAWMNSHDREYGSGDLVKAYNYYSSEITDSIGTPLTYEDGTPIYDENGEQLMEWTYIYAPANSLTYKDFNNGWAVGSYGQRINAQNTISSGERHVGTGEYGPLTIEDTGFSTGAISFLVCKNATDPASGWLQTTKKLQAPFDINVWMTGSGKEGLNNELELSVSSDSIEWTVIDTIKTTALKNVVKFIRSYEGTNEVYLKVACANHDNLTQQKTMVYDILITYHGENSIAAEQGTTGIKESNLSNKIKATQIYNLKGIQTNRINKGINIVKKIYDNGKVEIQKVFVK